MWYFDRMDGISNKAVIIFTISSYTLIIIILSSCAGGGRVPFWITRFPIDAKYYYGRGMSTENQKVAELSARADVAKSHEVEIHQQTTRMIVSEAAKGQERMYEKLIQDTVEKVGSRLRDCQIVESYYDKKTRTYYALARVEKTKVENIIYEEQHSIRNKVWTYYRSAVSAQRKGNIFTAISEYLRGMKEVTFLAPKYDFDEKNRRNDVLSVKLRNALDELISGIQVDIINDRQSGEFEEAIPEPLSITVKLAISESEVVPVKDLEVIYRYIKGTGLLQDKMGNRSLSELKTRTDRDGVAICYVAKIISLTLENLIGVTLNAKQFSGSLYDVDQSILDPILKSLESKFSHIFRYSSKLSLGESALVPFLRINGSSSEIRLKENEEINLEFIVRNKCYLHIFQLTTDGKLLYIDVVKIESPFSSSTWQLRSTSEGWLLSVRTKAESLRGITGSEAIVAVSAATRVPMPKRELSKVELFDIFNRIVGQGQWQAGYISYLIER